MTEPLAQPRARAAGRAGRADRVRLFRRYPTALRLFPLAFRLELLPANVRGGGPQIRVGAHRPVVDSWERIFDLDWSGPDGSEPKEEKSIQATVWEIALEQVSDYRFFVGR